MKKFKFLTPYIQGNQAGKITRYPETKNKSGVYIIKENNVIVYVGYSGTNLYRTLYRHFETWNAKYEQVVTYKNKLNKNQYTVRIILCTPTQAGKLEKMLIINYQPRDNADKYNSYEIKKADLDTIDQYFEIPTERDAPF